MKLNDVKPMQYVAGEVSLTYKREITHSPKQICSPHEVAELIRSMPDMQCVIDYKELAYIVYVNHTNSIVGVLKVGEGGIDSVNVDIRIVMQAGLLLSATGFFFVHNHPSNNTHPSKEDIKMSNDMKEIGRLLRIRLIDSIIISIDSMYSMLENGYV